MKRPESDRWTTAGICVVGFAAAAMSWTGWFLLAVMCGWPRLLSALLPFAVDVYAVTSARVWLRLPWVSEETRRFAAFSTFFAVGLSVAANAACRLMEDLGWRRAPWGVVVAVSGLAPLMLALVAHLQARLNADRAPDRNPGMTGAAVPPCVPDIASATPDMSAPDVRPPAAPRKSTAAPRKPQPVDVDTEARALTALDKDPDITAARLGQVIGVSERQARRIRSRLHARQAAMSVPRSTTVRPDMSGSLNGQETHDE